MFISLHATLMSHHLLYHSAAFACSKWLIISNSLRCTFFLEFGVISDPRCRLFPLSFLHFFSLSSFRVSLGILSSSLLGILLSVILPYCSLIGFVLPALLSLLLDPLSSCSFYLSSVESAWDILFSSLSGILSIFGFSLATFLPFYLSPPLPRPFSPGSFPSSFAFPFSGVQLVAYCSARSSCPSPL